MSTCDFLLEIGTEELPPKSLFTLAQALAEGVAAGLDGAGIARGVVEWFATPRRLAVRIGAVAARQPEQEVKRLGPALSAAFDASGQPTKAALGFAASCGVSLDQLQHVEGPKGKVLQYTAVKPGALTAALLPDLIATALKNLPIAKRMRWGSGTEEFVRPVHWVVLLFGDAVVDATVMGIKAGRHSYGHRFHAPGPIELGGAPDYPAALHDRGKVMVDVEKRRDAIRHGVTALAQSLGGIAVIQDELLDEVTALVEWPVPLAGRFDARFLELPPEVPIATMQDHQRYFAVRGQDGALLNHFITVANIESRDPAAVRDGNERVVRPRLTDAAFFWDTDRKRRLEQRQEELKRVTFQNQLGSLGDKSTRIAALAVQVAASIGADQSLAARAAGLAKCDLLTLMVGEFPELQGVMGRYYAQHDGEPAEVCQAIEEHYRPRFAGDRLPDSKAGVAVSIADKLDTLCGIFAIGQKPSGTRDPFGLRRAALGVLRICLERQLDVDLRQLVEASSRMQPVSSVEGTVDDDLGNTEAKASEVWLYLMERLRGLYLENDELGITTEMFDAVLGSQPRSPFDIQMRLAALRDFLPLTDALALSSANKRIANILRKTTEAVSTAVDQQHLPETAEKQLFSKLCDMEQQVTRLVQAREYPAALSRLAGLRQAVDAFFDQVMVMAEDKSIRSNRLALLQRVRGLFLQVADLSRLPG